MNNFIDLRNGKVDKRVPKNRFKIEFIDIDTITWLYKISSDTADFRHGDEVEEIQIFSITLKSTTLNKKELLVIQKAIPYPILFVVHNNANDKTNNNKNYFLIEDELFESDKQLLDFDNDILIIEKRSSKLTELYEDIAKAFIPIKHKDKESIAELIARYKNVQKLEKEIKALQRKVDSEKQPNKRIELNEKLKELKREWQVISG